MSHQKKITVTAALPYANGPVHLGHLAGCYLPADIYVRLLRMQGEDVIFICGSDEHGVPITIRARKEHRTPQSVVDEFHKIIHDSFRNFGISFDFYGRTSHPDHHNFSQEFFKNLYDKGSFIEEISEQYYDTEAGQFLADRYITGTCPRCSNERAYGDQCEKCGSTLSPNELINPVSALSGSVPELRKTNNWYLPLDIIQKDFLDRYINGQTGWKQNVFNQCQSWLKEGLRARAMTRDLDWGVKVPVEGADGKVLYVWFDAPIGYITFTKQLKPENWKEYWNEDAEIIHFIGKDNIVFHCLIFPAMLHVHGGYGLPAQVPANEFLNLEGDKISTSRNWAVWLHEYLQDFPGRTDELRYVLTSIMPETKDSEFTWKDYQARVNSELVAIVGNWVNRVVVLQEKFFQGSVQAQKELRTDELALLTEIRKSGDAAFDAIRQFRFREAMTSLVQIARMGNKYLADTEPWHLIKTDPAGAGSILNLAVQMVRIFGEYARPLLPETSEKILRAFGTGSGSAEGHTVANPGLLFRPVEDAEIEAQIAKLEATKSLPVSQVAPMKEEIQYPDFEKMDIRVATITHAEKVPKADKLLKLTLDTGNGERTVVSGIAEHYTAEEVIGQQVLLLANLAPRKLRGIESQGMILMAENAEGKLCFVQPSKNWMNGATVR